MFMNNDELKLVTVRPSRPFRIKAAHFTSTAKNIFLSVGSISYCLQEKALVTENLANGKTVPLNFANYNTNNGPTAVPEDAVEFVSAVLNPEVTFTDSEGNKVIINAKSNTKKEEIKHVDLESERIAKERAEAIAKAQEEARKAKEEEARKERELEEERKRHDEEQRKIALQKVYERENKNKKKEEKKDNSFTVSAVKEEPKKMDAPAAEQKEVNVSAVVSVKEEKKEDNKQNNNNNGKFDKNNKHNK